MWIGVDLGTYKTCLCHWKEGNYHIISENDDRYIVNYMDVIDGELIMSKYKKANSLHSIKRLFGMVDGANYLTILMLKKYIKVAEGKLGKKVKGLVVSIPDNYNEHQRKLLKGFGKELCVKIKLIQDSTAAALAFQNKGMEKKNVMIYNIGSGNVTAAIVETEGESIVVRESISDNIGADDCDYYMLQNLVEKYKVVCQKEKNQIVEECRKLRHELSTIKVSSYEIGFNGKVEKMSREYFESVCKDILLRIMEPARKLILKYNIEQVVMIGGGSRIDFIKRNIGSDKVSYIMNPEESIAIGAAIYSGMLNKDPTVPKKVTY